MLGFRSLALACGDRMGVEGGGVRSSDISVLKIITVSVSIQFWVRNFYFSSSFSFEIISVSITVSVLK